MNFKAYQNRLNHLLDLIEKGSVHSPKQLAKQFSCNEKTVREMINVLREQGFEIVYSRNAKKYLLNK